MSQEPVESVEPVDLATRSSHDTGIGRADALAALLTARACPFCTSSQQALMLDLTEHYVHCQICDALGPPHITILAAVAAWNGYPDVNNNPVQA